MEDVKIGGHTYRARKIDPLTQAHLSQALAPILGSVVAMRGLLQKVEQLEGETVEEAAKRSASQADMADIVPSLLKAWHDLPRTDTTFIIDTCMSVVTRCDGDPAPGKTWTKVWDSNSKQPMYDDIEMPTMLLICYNVIADSLSRFSLGRVFT